MLDLPTATHPVAVTQQFQPAKATPPAIQAFDCFHPTDVKTYDISQHCPTADPAELTDPLPVGYPDPCYFSPSSAFSSL